MKIPQGFVKRYAVLRLFEISDPESGPLPGDLSWEPERLFLHRESAERFASLRKGRLVRLWLLKEGEQGDYESFKPFEEAPAGECPSCLGLISFSSSMPEDGGMGMPEPEPGTCRDCGYWEAEAVPQFPRWKGRKEGGQP